MATTTTTNGATNGATTTTSQQKPKITIYTNHGCPYAHKVHIALKELGLEYDEVIIDLEKPREEWYLKINPRGLVPTLQYNDHLIHESSIICQFLADAHPSHLVPRSNDPSGPLTRARISFFADTYNSKIQPIMYGMFKAIGQGNDEGVHQCFDEMMGALRKEIEPLLEDANPFFGGSQKPTLAECLTASFVVRWYAYGKGGLIPPEFVDRLGELKNFSRWSKELLNLESVTYVFDEETTVSGTRNMIEKKFKKQ